MEPIAVAIGTVVAAVTLTWTVWTALKDDRKAAVRSDEVLAWAHESITVLRSLWVLCGLSEQRLAEPSIRQRLDDALFATSALVDQGRLYFRNTDSGYRAQILNYLRWGHELAERLPSADAVSRAELREVAHMMSKGFVEMAQKEVGRAITRDPATRLPGKAGGLSGAIERARQSNFKSLE